MCDVPDRRCAILDIVGTVTIQRKPITLSMKKSALFS
jgi:hypothetical protein